MCLGSAAPTYQTPAKRVVPEGAPSPNDKVNDQSVENVNDRSLQRQRRNENRSGTASKQKGQTSSKTNKAY